MRSVCGYCYCCAEAEVVGHPEWSPSQALTHVHGRMFVCPDCGNKRCPKATDHLLTCSGTNEPGQGGSRY